MTINSATDFVKNQGLLYSNSGYGVLQSPIDFPVLEQGGKLVKGIYVQVEPFHANIAILDDLSQEFAAWDFASDEDFLIFEKENL